MSAESVPITAARFSLALKDLSLESLHAKVAELRNNIKNLRRSNQELEDFIREQGDGGDEDRELMEVILENRGVMGRFEERIGLIRREVEERGMPFPEEDPLQEKQSKDEDVEMRDDSVVNGSVNGQQVPETRNTTSGAQSQTPNGQQQEEEGVFL